MPLLENFLKTVKFVESKTTKQMVKEDDKPIIGKSVKAKRMEETIKKNQIYAQIRETQKGIK